MFPNSEVLDHQILFFDEKNPEFQVLKQKDADIFLLYRLNREENLYDWTESKNTTLEECEEEAKKLLRA